MHGMAVVALDHLQPLAGEPLDARGREDEGVGHLAPDQQPEPVAPIEEARVLDLLVDADAVEAERLDELDLAPERVGVGRGQVRLRPVALLQHQPQVVGAAVEQEAAVRDAGAAQARSSCRPRRSTVVAVAAA